MDWFKIQAELKKLSFYGGEIDGIPGRLTTAAVKQFQVHNKVFVKFPGTVGPKTLAALFPSTDTPAPSKGLQPPWFELLLSKKGLHEGKDNSELRKFLKSDGATLGDPSKLPWCGDAVETVIAITLPQEVLPGNPYLARNWGKFGQKTPPRLGAVASFWRGKPNGTSGHVGLVAGHGIEKGKKVLYILGGNQSDRISVAPLGTDRLLATRWPLTFEMPDKIWLPKMVGGQLSLNEA